MKIKLLLLLALFTFSNSLFAKVCPDPTGDAQQLFCESGNPTLGDVDVNGDGLQFYADAAGSTSLALTTSLEDGQTYYVSQTETGCTESALLAVTIYLNPDPTGLSVSVDSSSCAHPGNNVYIVDPGDVVNISAHPFYELTEDFEGALGVSWKTVDNSLLLGTAWTDQNSPYTTSSGAAISSPDGSQFYISEASVAVVDTELIYDFTLLDAESASLSFEHFFEQQGTSIGTVEISTDGGTTYASLSQYTTTQGAAGVFATESIDLGAYLGDAGLRVRFHFEGDLDASWSIDNVVLTKTTEKVGIALDNDMNIYQEAGLTNPYDSSFPFGFTDLYFSTSTEGIYEYSINTNTLTGEADPVTTCGVTLTENITIMVGGYQYDTLCFGDTPTLSDLGVPGTGLVWYSDAAGTTTISETTTAEGGETYYVDLGQPDCSELLTVKVSYNVDEPRQDGTLEFCSAATWAQIDSTEDGDRLEDLPIYGDDCGNLTWYSDAAGTTEIDADTELTDGTAYYVSQSIDGCESSLLVITATERECACIKNGNFETACTPSDEGYEFYQEINNSAIDNHNTCNYDKAAANLIPMGATNSMAAGNDAVFVTKGSDPTLLAAGINFPRTNPDNPDSQTAIRLNRNVASPSKITTMTKDFIAGEVLSFHFALVLMDPDHGYDEQPYLQVRIYDKEDNLIQSRCVVSDPTDCIFHDGTPPGSDTVLYSDWSCIKLNTNSIQGEPARVEFTVSGCALTVHYGYAYIDDIYIGDDAGSDCTDSAFGYVNIDSIDEEGVFPEDCSLLETPDTGACVAMALLNTPTFPIDICGTYDGPIGGGLDTFTMDIMQGDQVVGTLSSPDINTSEKTYCFNVEESDITAPLYGEYTFSASANFIMNCGAPYTYEVTSLSQGFRVCPVAGCPVDMSVCTDDPSSSGYAEFDLTLQDDDIKGDMEADDVVVTYYEDEADALAGTNAITDADKYTNTDPSSQTIYARLEFDYAGLDIDEIEDCYDVVSFDLAIGTTPDIAGVSDISDYALCADGSSEQNFNLTTKEDEIFAGLTQSDYTWDYYETEADAEMGDDAAAIDDPTDYDSIEGTVYVRVENAEGCPAITSIELVIYPALNYEPAADLELCGTPGSKGIAEFNLDEATNQIIGTGSDLNLSYYKDETEAQIGDASDELPTTYTNTTDAYNQTIYVRISDPTTGCYQVEPLDLVVNDTPTATQPGDMQFCDNGGNGAASFDLAGTKSTVLNGQDPLEYAVSYYKVESEANAGINNIPSAELPDYVPVNPTQTIYVRVENAISPECYSITSFTLTVNTVSVGTVDDLFECDGGNMGSALFDLTANDTGALDGQSPNDYEVYYYTDQTEAVSGDTSLAITDPENFINNTATNPQEIWVTVISDADTGCFATTSFNVEATDSQPINEPTPLTVCDTDNDGFAPFDLTTKTAEIAGASDVTVTYHPTQSDANNDLNAFSSPYTNVSGYTQTVYVRIEDNLNGCVLFHDLNLIVYDSPSPVIADPAPLSGCDENGDGEAYFDLTDSSSEILNGLAPGDHTITYYPTEQDAKDDTNEIGGANDFPTGTIWIRVENTNDCYGVTSIDLEVYPLPEPVQPTPLEECDDTASGSDTDERSSFDLTAKEQEITGGNSSWTVSWYSTDDPTEVGSATAIATPEDYQNAENYQTITAVVTSAHGCTAMTTMTLTVNPLPLPTPSEELDPYIICDDDNDGFAEFDLSTQDDLIANGEANMEITYYLTLEDAESGEAVGQLDDLFGNTVANEQTIFARSTNINTGCYSIVELVLEVTPLPTIPTDLPDMFACDASGSTTASFDLTENEELIYGNQDSNDFELSYYLSQAGAQAGTGDPIGNPLNYSNGGVSPTTIWVRLENIESGCTRIASFDLVAGQLPEIVTPAQRVACDDTSGDPDDGVGLFDLTASDLEITQGDTSLAVTYYADQTALDNDDPITDPANYTNAANPQTLQVKVTSQEGCAAFTTLTLNVVPNPSLEAELEPLEQCDVDNDGFAEFDLEAEIPVILDGEPDVEVTFHLTLDDAQNGVEAIDISEPFGTTVANEQTIYVRAENTGPAGANGTGCYVTRPLILRVIPSPEIGDLEDLYVCDDDTPDGFAQFDLTLNQDNILNGQDPATVTITYHTTLTGAEEGTGAVAVPTNYTNTTNGQAIYVRLESDDTDCFDTFAIDGDNSFTLNVEPQPIAEQPTRLEICDDAPADGTMAEAVFDLTVKEGEIAGQAQGTPAPSSYEFTYYANQADFNNDQPIEDPTAYTNTANPQTIYIRVSDNNTQGSCEATTTLTIQVLPLPSPSEIDPDVLRIEECDDDADGIAADPFDLTLSGAMIAEDENVVLSYYTNEQAAEEGDDTVDAYIEDPSAYVNEPNLNTVNADGQSVQVIYVRVDNGVNGNFCYVIVEMEIVVNPSPALNPDGDPFGYTLCADGGGTIARLYPGDIAANLYKYVGGNSDTSALIPLLDPATNQSQDLEDYTISYYTSEADAEAGTNPIAPGYQAATGEILFIRVVNTETGCYNMTPVGEVIITVEPRPGIAVGPISAAVFCSDEPAGEDATLDLTGYNDQVDPNDGPNSGTGVVYYASLDDYNNGDAIADPSAYTTIENPQTIIAEVINTTTLCESSTYIEIPVEVEPTPVVDISSYDGMVICSDSNPNTPVIGGDYSLQLIDTGLPDDGSYTFTWSLDGNPLPENGPTIEVTEAGTYSVTVANVVGNQCENTSSATFEGHNPPEFNVSPLSVAFEGDHSLVITNITGNGDYEFRLDNGPWMNLGENESLTIDGISGGDHLVYGRDKNGCGATAHPISFIDFPKFFTPNEDGYNDTWNIFGLGDQPGAKIYIFDRYGKLLKQLAPGGAGWDGTFNGTPMPSNDYWFRVEYNKTYIDADDVPQQSPGLFKNHFTLKR